MMNTQEDLLTQIADNLDRRRMEITNLRRILMSYTGKPLENTAVRMSIPMIYAHWEGYVKEACELYLEHVEASVASASHLQPALLGYLWLPMLRPIAGGLSFERRKAIAECALTHMTEAVRFEATERAINTGSNLNFSKLERIAKDLCLDIGSLVPRKRHLNALVHLRNNIAHGANPQGLRYSNFEEHAEAILQLMQDFERVLVSSIRRASFSRRRSRGTDVSTGPKKCKHQKRAAAQRTGMS
jgi:hypothetical protein